MQMQQIFPNGIQPYLVGGLVMGLGVALAFALSGLVVGMSTVFSSTWSFVSRLSFFQDERFVGSRSWRLALALGLVIGGALYLVTVARGVTFQTHVATWQLALGGFIAGFGARMSNGCTSGHGICGISSLQRPSIVAVVTFLVTAIVTAQLVAALGGAQ
jgi:uncharacterized membrane protein YedE/YeeE